jgi:hypothetical protein
MLHAMMTKDGIVTIETRLLKGPVDPYDIAALDAYAKLVSCTPAVFNLCE